MLNFRIFRLGRKSTGAYELSYLYGRLVGGGREYKESISRPKAILFILCTQKKTIFGTYSMVHTASALTQTASFFRAGTVMQFG